MKDDMGCFSGQVKRSLEERKFNQKDEQCCRTGGRIHGCPFFRLSAKLKWICTLYRLAPGLIKRTKRYKRLYACLNNREPPVKRKYLIHYTKRHVCEVEAVSTEEAYKIFENNYVGNIEEIAEGNVVEYENLV